MAELDLLPYDEYMAQLPRKVMSAGVLLRDEAGRVLLVEPSYKPGWEIPGGIVERGEPPWVTAARELHEEVGLERSLRRLLVVDHVPPDDDQAPERIAYVFDGGLIHDDDIGRLAFSAEIVSAELCTLEAVRTRTKQLLADRLAAGVDAATGGVTALCEQGRRVA